MKCLWVSECRRSTLTHGSQVDFGHTDIFELTFLITERFQIRLYNFGFSWRIEKSGNTGPEFLHISNWLEPMSSLSLLLEQEVL